MIGVLVTGAGGGVGQGVIKSLKLIGDMDLHIIGGDMSPQAAGLYACDRAYIVEGCRSPTYVESLAKIFEAETVDYYIPGTDIELAYCAENKAMFAERFGVKVVACSPETVRIADDKQKTADFLKANGLPHPASKSLAEALKDDALEFPVIVKPAVGFRSIGVELAHNWAALEAYDGDPDTTVVQEAVGDAASEYTCTIVGAGGSLSPVLPLRRDLRSGDTYRAFPEKSEVIEDYVTDVASRLGIDGACNFQLRLDREGTPKIFEINSRFSGTTPFCAQLGFNPVEYYLKHDRGLTYTPDIQFDKCVLRYWSELVLNRADLATLSDQGAISPEAGGQFSLYGAPKP